MTASFEVLRPDGTVAVSSEYKHYRFVKKIRGVGNFWDTSGQQYSDSVLVAFRALSPVVSTNRFSKGAHNMWGTSTPPPAGATLSFYTEVTSDVYIFDISPQTPHSSSGLQVMNREGEVTFDTNYRYLRVIDVIVQGHAGMTETMPISRNYAGHMIACVPIKRGVYTNASGGEEWYGATWEYACDENFFVQYKVNMYDWGGGDFSSSSREYMCLIVDVSHVELL